MDVAMFERAEPSRPARSARICWNKLFSLEGREEMDLISSIVQNAFSEKKLSKMSSHLSTRTFRGSFSHSSKTIKSVLTVIISMNSK